MFSLITQLSMTSTHVKRTPVLRVRPRSPFALRPECPMPPRVFIDPRLFVPDVQDKSAHGRLRA